MLLLLLCWHNALDLPCPTFSLSAESAHDPQGDDRHWDGKWVALHKFSGCAIKSALLPGWISPIHAVSFLPPFFFLWRWLCTKARPRPAQRRTALLSLYNASKLKGLMLSLFLILWYAILYSVQLCKTIHFHDKSLFAKSIVTIIENQYDLVKLHCIKQRMN